MTKYQNDLNNIFNRINKVALGFEPYFKGFESNFNVGNYPPYNIINRTEDEITVEVAIAGFSKDDITIEHEDSTLRVSGARKCNDEDTDYMHKGISNKPFELSWTLADHVEVDTAKIENGILHISMTRLVPESKKAKLIDIL